MDQPRFVPPVYRFVNASEPDPVASSQTGVPQYKDVTFVYIHIPGDNKNVHKDIARQVTYDTTEAEVKVEEEQTIFKEIDGELKELTETVTVPKKKQFHKKKVVYPRREKLEGWLHNKTMPSAKREAQAALDHYLQCWERFEKNEDQPINGTPLQGWRGAPEGVKKRAMELGITSVEDAANMTEDALRNIGMGGRDLKNSATAWLSQDTSKEETANKMKDLENKNDALQGQLSALEAKMAALSEPKPKGRPRKEAA